jgi:hypothetical protein
MAFDLSGLRHELRLCRLLGVDGAKMEPDDELLRHELLALIEIRLSGLPNQQTNPSASGPNTCVSGWGNDDRDLIRALQITKAERIKVLEQASAKD